MRELRFKIRGQSKIRTGMLVEDKHFIGGARVDVGDFIYSLASIEIIEKKDKSDLKKLLLERKRAIKPRLQVIDEKYKCSNCKDDVRTSSIRNPQVLKENDTYVVWRFTCSCGFSKTVTVRLNLN